MKPLKIILLKLILATAKWDNSHSYLRTSYDYLLCVSVLSLNSSLGRNTFYNKIVIIVAAGYFSSNIKADYFCDKVPPHK